MLSFLVVIRGMQSDRAQEVPFAERTAQNARSTGCSRGRGVVRLRTASCWRSARFSATRLARGFMGANNVLSSTSKNANTTEPARFSDLFKTHLSRSSNLGVGVRLDLQGSGPAASGMFKE